ncbi:phage tail tape measure protein [Plantactinospora siamensis]|uniref:Phage tail tape measure protein n=1 Tax=Plantactinospora siamensis TaxID=555372 RepID=A0ABV6P6J0_9ACTN
MALRTVGVKLTAEVSSFMAGIRQAGVATKGFTSEMDKAAKSGHLDRVANSAGAVGLSLVGMAGFAIKSSADFEKSMSAVSAATHASAGDIERLRAAALQAGKDTSFSATEAADGITELSKAGVSTADVLGGGLRGALDLAAAGQLGVGEAAETAASAMTQFGLSGKDVPHVADLLAAAAGKAQGSVHDMGYALSQSGLVAHQFGLSVEDTTGTLAAFASAGLLGSDSGTSFKTMLLALANPSAKARDTMQELGIETYDASGKFIGITGLAGQLRDKLSGLTQEQRNSALATIFGSDAIRAASILYDQGAQGIQTWIGKVNEQGYASETAAKMTDNLAGDVERLKGSLETLSIQAGSSSSGGLRTLVRAADQLVGSLSLIPGPVQTAGVAIAGIGGVVLLVGAGMAKLRAASAGALEELAKAGPVGEKAAASLDRASKAATRAGIALGAMQVASAVFGESINPQIDALNKRLETFTQTGEVGGEAARVFGGDLGKLDTALKNVADSGAWSDFARGTAGLIEGISHTGAVFDSSLQHDKERVDALDQALANLAQSGNGQQAAALFDKVAQRAAAQGVSVNELRKALPQYAAALDTAGSAADGAAGKTGELTGALGSGAKAQREYKTATEAAAGAARGERDALASLASMMKAETDPVFGLLNAEQKLTEAQKAAAKAIKEHGRNSTEAKEKTRDLALAAIDLQGKAGALGDTFDGKMTPALRKTLQAAGLTGRQIDDVAKQFREAKKDGDQYAKQYKGSVKLDGYPAVEKQLDRLSAWQQALKKGLNPAFNGPIVVGGKGYSEGGWTGPGATMEPAGVVHADEFVIKKSSRQRIESAAPGLLDQMNATGQAPGYAGGGMVWPYPMTVRGTRIPSRGEVAGVVTPAGPGGGQTYPWILSVVHGAFPGLHAISTFRPGARTLSGNRSYHAVGRAVDFPPSRELAEYWNRHYMARTKELISPWNDLNIWNGRRHAYTGAIWRQHNFAGGNAHDHIAMAGGGVIAEPVLGYGVNSGRSYSFGERGPETVTPGLPGAGGPMRVEVVLSVDRATASADRQLVQGLMRSLQTEVRIQGGNVQQVLGGTRGR